MRSFLLVLLFILVFSVGFLFAAETEKPICDEKAEEAIEGCIEKYREELACLSSDKTDTLCKGYSKMSGGEKVTAYAVANIWRDLWGKYEHCANQDQKERYNEINKKISGIVGPDQRNKK